MDLVLVIIIMIMHTTIPLVFVEQYRALHCNMLVFEYFCILLLRYTQ